MLKKLLTGLGIVLLLTVGAIGVRTFQERKTKKELVPAAPITVKKDNAKQTTAAPSFNKKLNSTDSPASIWVVVNKKRPLKPLSYSPADLVPVGNNQTMRSEAAGALGILIAVAKSQGLSIKALSGYRSYDDQTTVYNNEVANYGQAVADSESAKPGTSEHQTGLAMDVGGGGCGIEDCFGNTAEGKWLAANAYTFGFIVRYTAEKQSVTGYRAEPWHIRYVGAELSTEMHAKNITTLEEFFGL
ncbi:D-Ala-D-Ala carboxypeptidase VanY [soil metagenome]